MPKSTKKRSHHPPIIHKVSVLVPLVQFEADHYFSNFIASLNYPNLEILIYNNGLSTKTVSKIQSYYPTIKLIGTGHNIQYAASINALALEASGKYLYIANCDTKLAPDCLHQLVAANLVIAGPAVYNYTSPSTISTKDLPIQSFNTFTGQIINLTTFNSPLPIPVRSVSGCGFLISRTLFISEGMYDPRFWIYWEDADLGLRLSNLGFGVAIVPQAKIWHVSSATMSQNPTKNYYLARNYFLFMTKHLHPLGLLFLHFTKTIPLFIIKAFKHEHAFAQGIQDYLLGRFYATNRQF